MAFTRSLPIITFLVVVLSSSQHQIAGAGDDDEIRNNSGKYPLVISTWPFQEAVRAAWRAVDGGLSAVDAVVEGCSACEELRCDGTVGPGGSPDEDGETTIDALVMNGVTMEVGAVAALRFVKDGIRAARLVMQHTKHTLLVGEKASDFAISMGLPGPTDLSSSDSVEKWSKWKASSCQPNFRKNVSPVNGCGPYEPIHSVDVKDGTCSIINLVGDRESRSSLVGPHNHDTISMAAIDKMGHVACGTSTNGATFKIPGRVGDGPIAGSSAYAIDEVGACGATGDGDIMMRFLPCYQVVESMRLGMEPGVAAKDAISRITKKFPDFVGAVFAVNKNGVHSGACHGWTFQYSVRSPEMDDVQRQSTCLGLRVFQGVVTEIKLADTYSVEFINYGLVRGPNIIKVGKRLLGRDSPNHEMYRFMLRSVRKSTSQPSVLVPTTCIFGHEDSQTCQTWVERVDASLKSEFGRPKNLMVFVNPKSGKTNGYRTWESVSPIFSHAKVKTNVIVTQRAGHAFDVMASTANGELNSYDGFICVGGDGFFNELLNGFLLSRHKAPYPPCPSDLVHYDESDASAPDSERGNAEISGQNEEQFHLLPDSTQNRYKATSIEEGSYNSDHDADFSFEKFRFGIIPAGSTDAIVMCTTGARDPVTSALHIVLGKRLHLDLAQVVSWKSSATSEAKPRVRYAASFAGYGFYGDVITESEKYRWMGPKRYDYAGTKVFMRHRSYEAEIAYMESESEKSNYKLDKGSLLSRVKDICIPDKSERTICRANCGVCNMKPLNVPKRLRGKPYSRPKGYKWRKCKGHFLSVGAAIMSNRNERAPDGLVADAHLSDGFLHLLLIRDCPRSHYLCHLTQLAKRGGRPLNFEFVEHHKTSAFTFTSLGEESVWNLDGELFPARQLSAQVFRGLVSLFASGPEV